MQLVQRLVKREVCFREVQRPRFVLPLVVSYRKFGVKHTTSDGLERRKVSSGYRRSVSGNEGWGGGGGDRD